MYQMVCAIVLRAACGCATAREAKMQKMYYLPFKANKGPAVKVTQGDFQGKRGRVFRSMVGKPTVKVAGHALVLGRDFKTVKLLTKEERRGFLTMVIILALGVTLIGLIIAIPWFIVSKKVQATVGFETNDGKRFVAVTDKAEWAIVSEHLTAAF